MDKKGLYSSTLHFNRKQLPALNVLINESPVLRRSYVYGRRIAGRIGAKVTSGAIVTDLVRPVNIFSMSWQIEFSDICSNFLLRGLPVIVVFGQRSQLWWDLPIGDTFELLRKIYGI